MLNRVCFPEINTLSDIRIRIFRSVSAEFLSDSYVLSDIWKTKQTYIETEEMLA